MPLQAPRTHRRPRSPRWRRGACPPRPRRRSAAAQASPGSSSSATISGTSPAVTRSRWRLSIATTVAQPQPPRHSTVPSVKRPSADVVPAVRAELALERLHDLLRSTERAGHVRAHLDERAPDRLEPELVVERRDREAVRRRDVERVRDVAKRLGRKPAAVLLLGQPQGGKDRRRALRILGAELAQTRREWRTHQRSASPMTGSSEPATATRSATRQFWTTVAVAWSAAKLGARKRTRHGREPPSETR